MSTLRVAFYLAGGVCEVVGIILVAVPDLAPWWHAGRLGLRKAWDRLLVSARTLFRRQQDISVTGSTGGGVALSGSARVIVSASPDATIEEKVAYLLGRDEEMRALQTIGETSSV